MNPTETSSPRRFVYVLLIVLAAGGVAGRLASAELVLEPSLHKKDANNPNEKGRKWPATRPEPMPTFSSNDRSRWATVRALVDEGTFVVGRRQKVTGDPPYKDSGIIFEDGWGSVDKILNPETYEFYSTKPPLLSTLAAGLYWLLQSLFGWTLKTNPFSVVRTTLVLFNLVPFVLYLGLLTRLVERHGTTDWGRLFVVATAGFATLLTPFLITFNNHTVAACCVMFAVYAVFPLVRLPWDRAPQDAMPPPAAFAAAGFFAGFAACNELPALAFAAALGGLLVVQAPGRTLLAFLPALLLPLVGQYALNYLALGEWDFAYSKFGTQWYEYPGSHWQKPEPGKLKTGIDWAWQYEDRTTYTFNVLLGHHGLFSLTPIWILALVGTGWAVRQATASRRVYPGGLVGVGAITLLLSVVVIGFYLFNDPTTHNYGGWTNGLRWLMWLTPLWLLTMLPVADWLGQRRWGRVLGYVLLAWSVLSVNYFSWNPWRHPWLFNVFDSAGGIPY
jgi:hypothetical protein